MYRRITHLGSETGPIYTTTATEVKEGFGKEVNGKRTPKRPQGVEREAMYMATLVKVG